MTHVVAGPTVTQILADLGAEVIKVEPPPRGEIFRNAEGFGPSAFLAINRGKKSIMLDIRKEEGMELFLRLASACDVLVENLSPDAVERLGLSYERLAGANPRLVYCKITSFGEGPYRDVPAWDPVLQAAAGIMSTTGIPPKGYVRAGISLVDMSTAFHAVVGIMGALLEKESEGRGSLVEVSMLDAALYYMNYWLIYNKVYGRSPGPLGTSHFFASPYGLFETKGGRVYLAITNDDYWAGFCAALGFDDLARDRRFSTAAGRVKRKRALEAAVAKKLKKRPIDAVLEALAKARVPHARMNTVATLLDDPVVRARGATASYAYQDGGRRLEYETVVNPAVFDGVRRFTKRRPPAPGEHTVSILKELLGVSGAEVAKLESAGVVKLRPETENG